MLRRIDVLLAASGCLVFALACARNPVSGWPEFVVVSKAQEQKIGDQEAVKIEQEMGFVDDPELAKYVSAVGDRVSAFSPRDDVTYRFHVVDSTMINAFALPGGYVYVTRGLLVRMNREDELANVLGHEVGHVAARHAVQRITRATPGALITGISSGVVGLVLPGLGRALGTIGSGVNSLALAPYSRGQETQSDRLGQEMASKAGWDPMGMADFMRTLQREEALSGEEGAPYFLRTHPLTASRVEDGTAYAETLERAEPDPIAKTHAAFLEELDGLVVGPNPAAGIFREDEFLQPDLDLYLRVPKGWQTINAPSFIAAVQPENEAQIVLSIAGEGDDALEVAKQYSRGEGARLGLRPQATKLGMRDGARATARINGTAVDVSWIAYNGHVYQITSVCLSRNYSRYETPFIDVALSLRPLTAEERASITEDRLRIVRARAGESLEALVERSGGTWSVEETAVANGLPPDAKLADGQRVKVPIRQRYRSPEG
jgi:predicted Zn-dependent protease